MSSSINQKSINLDEFVLMDENNEKPTVVPEENNYSMYSMLATLGSYLPASSSPAQSTSKHPTEKEIIEKIEQVSRIWFCSESYSAQYVAELKEVVISLQVKNDPESEELLKRARLQLLELYSLSLAKSDKLFIFNEFLKMDDLTNGEFTDAKKLIQNARKSDQQGLYSVFFDDLKIIKKSSTNGQSLIAKAEEYAETLELFKDSENLIILGSTEK